MGSKRGVQVELAASLIKMISPRLCVWGISATMGNLDEAMRTLLGNRKGRLIRAGWKKALTINSLMPAKFERLAWSGHLGLALVNQVVGVIEKHGSTLIFTNTRAQAEIWYHRILDAQPELSGAIALHHGSIAKELRYWVEDALHESRLRAVVCTSSLDLGVDFRPVDAVIQIGGPKGVARFAQRAGRSGHAPHETSQIYFLPTHGLELIEASALRNALDCDQIESRLPMVRSFDVLVQFLCTLAVGDGFEPDSLAPAIRDTHAFETMDEQEWNWCLQFITTGGKALEAYSDYQRVQIVEGVWRILDQKLARKHRMSIGTIVSDAMLKVKWVKGKVLGHVEEYFAAGMEIGDSFWFAGVCLEFVRFKELTIYVKRSKKRNGRIPVYMGGRLSLSSELGEGIRREIDAFASGRVDSTEMIRVRPLLELQLQFSSLPKMNELLVESFESKDGFHVCVFPFEGRDIHEGMGMLLAQRWSQMRPVSFSIACNDYGFEMLSDQPIPIDELWTEEAWSVSNLMDDLQAGVNASEMAKRRFRDIAVISGLTFQGFVGKHLQGRHLQSHSGLVFEVFRDFDSENLLYQQAYEELLYHQLQWERMRSAIQRIGNQKVTFSTPNFPTPFSFPLVVDRLRSSLSSEDLETRINKMLLESRA
jgi:ATP-dependent Lhr-like helicase